MLASGPDAWANVDSAQAHAINISLTLRRAQLLNIKSIVLEGAGRQTGLWRH